MRNPQYGSMKIPGRSVWIVLWILAVILFLYPIKNLPVRLGMILFTAGAIAGSIWSAKRRKPIFYSLLAGVILAIMLVVAPGRDGDPQQLRETYLAALRSYEGTRYIWGGENVLGIDCSGLVRAGLIKANIEEGCLTFNPRLIRFGLSLWWHDCTAKALGEEYRGETSDVLTTVGINSLDENQVNPGDLSVTASGVHVLAYLGGKEWIEADPHYGRVVMVEVPTERNPWFQEPVHIVRWVELAVK